MFAYVHNPQANVFISPDQHVQLADFGLAGLGDTMTTAAATATNQASSSRWGAPELHDPQPDTFQQRPPRLVGALPGGKQLHQAEVHPYLVGLGSRGRDGDFVNQ